MNTKNRKLARTTAKISEESAVEQEFMILPDGRIEIPWISPEATRLVLVVYEALSDKPFPVKALSGNLYCG